MTEKSTSRNLAPAAMAILVLLVYARGLTGPFLYDDQFYVVENPAVQSLAGALKTFGHPSAADDTGHFTYQVYRPLMPLIYALIRAVSGSSPFGFHLVNLILHALCVLLLFFLFRRLTENHYVALAAAAWWAVHPVQVEAVEWISGLDDVLGPTLLLAVLLLLCKERTIPALLVYLAALLAKETAMMGVGLVFGLKFILSPGENRDRIRRAVWAALPFLAIAVMFFVLRYFIVGLQQIETPWSASLAGTLLIAVKTFLIYLRLIFFPLGLRINYLPDLESALSVLTILGFVLILALAFVAVRCITKAPLITFGIFWLALGLFPVSNIIPIDAFIGERFLYLPLMGVALIVADVASRLNPPRRLLIAGWSALLFIFCVLSFSRIGVWLNEETFLKDIVQKEPRIIGYQRALGAYYRQQQRFPEAAAVYETMRRRWPESLGVVLDLAELYVDADQPEKAEPLFKEVLLKRPGITDAAAGLAQVFLKLGRSAEAEQLFQQLVARHPNDPSFTGGLQKAQAALQNAAPGHPPESQEP